MTFPIKPHPNFYAYLTWEYIDQNTLVGIPLGLALYGCNSYFHLLIIMCGKQLSWPKNVNHYVPNSDGLAIIEF